MSDESSNDKETVPPPPGDEVDEHEATVVSARPDKLLAELARAGQGADRGEPGEPASGRPGPTSEGGGLRQMFARNPMHIRDVLPTEAEGDALGVGEVRGGFDDGVARDGEAAVRRRRVDALGRRCFSLGYFGQAGGRGKCGGGHSEIGLNLGAE